MTVTRCWIVSEDVGVGAGESKVTHKKERTKRL